MEKDAVNLILQPDPQKMRSARLRSCLVIEEFSERVSISVKQIQNIETGYSKPYAWQVAMWAEVCDVPIKNLFTRTIWGKFLKRKSNNVRKTA